jgi:hypothetical protein
MHMEQTLRTAATITIPGRRGLTAVDVNAARRDLYAGM